MSTTWYRIKNYCAKGESPLESVEVLRETPQFIVRTWEWNGARKERRESKGNEYWPSRELAEAEILRRMTANRDNSRRSYDYAEAELQEWLSRDSQ